MSQGVAWMALPIRLGSDPDPVLGALEEGASRGRAEGCKGWNLKARSTWHSL